MPLPPHRQMQTDQTGSEAEIKPCGLCLRCVDACPSGALHYLNRVWSLDLRRCLFCRECATVCPNSLISQQSA
jgi:formate hydrogenlyase subunit 6/NADH:ubiquinone oxidoreductase subunit I